MPSNLLTAVLDDDPTGVQTVHGCLAATRGDSSTPTGAVEDRIPVCCLLTSYPRQRRCPPRRAGGGIG